MSWCSLATEVGGARDRTSLPLSPKPGEAVACVCVESWLADSLHPVLRARLVTRQAFQQLSQDHSCQK